MTPERTATHIAPYTLSRVCTLIRPTDDHPLETRGVLNPASARAANGELYLFPRIVDNNCVSRISRARVLFDDEGRPVRAEQEGIVLEPTTPWEHNAVAAGVEDPRMVYMKDLDLYVMTYIALGPAGPRLALAVSDDLLRWRRLGPVVYAYDQDLAVDLNLYPNKDATFFPEPVMSPDGELSFALLHRPMWDLGWYLPNEHEYLPAGIDDPRPSIWVSFAHVSEVKSELINLCFLESHRLVALPEYPWEALKIGCGTPPVRLPEGWLIMTHGISVQESDDESAPRLRYSTGAMILDSEHVNRVICRSPAPLLQPEIEEECNGVVDEVVFPTAIDMSDDGSGYVFYGMADKYVGVARLERQSG